MRVFVTGGIKSGKSSFALDLAKESFQEKLFLATALPFDDEMAQKIDRHKKDRGDGFRTIEEPVEIGEAVRNDMVVDCLTMWMNNLFYQKIEDRWEAILGQFLERMGANLIVVSNEIGLGNIPADAMTRRYNAYLASANKQVAAVSDQVYFMVSGIPMRVK